MYGQMVSLRDYENFGQFGFGQASEAHIDNLNKALTAGYQMPRTDGGSALRVESLEATLRVLTFQQQHVRLWRDINKTPAFSTTEEFNIQSAYGGDGGLFTQEGGLPQAQDAAYQRRVAFVKFAGTTREVSHPMTLVRPAHGNVIALETQNGAIWLMERMERALFLANSDMVPEAWDGLDKQIQDDPIAQQFNVIDLRGAVLTQDRIEEACNTIVEAYGQPTVMYLAPRALSDLGKTILPQGRYSIGEGPNAGRLGIAIKEVETTAGIVPLKSNVFLRSGRNNGVKKPPSASTSALAPSAPTIALAAAVGAAGSKFAAGDVGSYRYQVTAQNKYGESAASAESTTTVAAAGDGVDITITDGGGANTATSYRVYRSRVGGAAGSAEFCYEVRRVGAAASTVSRDLNFYLPGTSRCYIFQNNLQAMGFRQLAPMMKIPLATLAASIRWMQLIYGTPIAFAPRKHVIFINCADD